MKHVFLIVSHWQVRVAGNDRKLFQKFDFFFSLSVNCNIFSSFSVDKAFLKDCCRNCEEI